MFSIEKYIQRIISHLKIQFGSRLIYVGLQGSYFREEANPSSDIDVMVVLDTLSLSDLADYRAVIESLEYPERSCGFICSREDLMNWNHLELCNLVNGTKDYYGVLRELIPDYTEEDLRSFVQLSINNLYHEICHRYVHGKTEKNMDALPYMYKGVFFILQNLYCLTHGVFVVKKAELAALLEGKSREVLMRSIGFADGTAYDYAESFELLFAWCQETLQIL